MNNDNDFNYYFIFTMYNDDEDNMTSINIQQYIL